MISIYFQMLYKKLYEYIYIPFKPLINQLKRKDFNLFWTDFLFKPSNNQLIRNGFKWFQITFNWYSFQTYTNSKDKQRLR